MDSANQIQSLVEQVENNPEFKISQKEINKSNEVVLDGKKYGIISGFELKLDNKVISNSLFSISHVKKSIRNMIEQKIEQFLNAPDDAITFGEVSKVKLNGEILI